MIWGEYIFVMYIWRNSSRNRECAPFCIYKHFAVCWLKEKKIGSQCMYVLIYTNNTHFSFFSKPDITHNVTRPQTVWSEIYMCQNISRSVKARIQVSSGPSGPSLCFIQWIHWSDPPLVTVRLPQAPFGPSTNNQMWKALPQVLFRQGCRGNTLIGIRSQSLSQPIKSCHWQIYV